MSSEDRPSGARDLPQRLDAGPEAVGVVRVGALEAQRLLSQEGYVFLDVRTEAEFAAGHPAGAWNLPWQLQAPEGLVPNTDFVPLVRALFGLGAKLLLGCKCGQRSLRAAEALVAEGHREVVELRPGYDGLRDAFGRSRERGWAASGLPVAKLSEGRSYVELRARVAER